MALYDRFRGYDDDGTQVPKLPIWPTITTVAEILSGELTDAEAISRFNLDANEQVEFNQAKAKVVGSITAMTTSLIGLGLDTDTSTTISKAVARNDFTQTLMKVELQYSTRESFNTDMGIS
tara:strand:- start:740 stop:1102 length:363 start_codon:yes stop_codon:yes gene_type:complete